MPSRENGVRHDDQTRQLSGVQQPNKVIIHSLFGVHCSRPGYTPKGKGEEGLS